MTVREFINRLSSLPEALLDMPAYHYSSEGYVEIEEDPHPVCELGEYDDEQYIVCGGEAYPTGEIYGVVRPTRDQLTNCVHVIIV